MAGETVVARCVGYLVVSGLVPPKRSSPSSLCSPTVRTHHLHLIFIKNISAQSARTERYRLIK